MEEVWGMSSLAVREIRQVLVGNQLLLFSFQMMLLLYVVGGCGALEHPAPPSEEHLASIWRIPFAILLCQLPGVVRHKISQGLLGAKSPKPTQPTRLCGACLAWKSHIPFAKSCIHREGCLGTVAHHCPQRVSAGALQSIST